MNKRGQIYILAAIILSIAIFILAKRVNISQQESLSDDFEKLSNNYERESIRFVNSLLLNPEQNDIQDAFLNFTFLFTSYSKTQNPDFGMIYVFDYEGKLQIGNFLSNEIIIDNGTASTDLHTINGCFTVIPAVIEFQGLSFTSAQYEKEAKKCSETFPSISQIWVQIDSYWYPIKITKNKPQIVIVSREETQEQRQVFLGGEEDAIIKEDAQKPQAVSDLCLEIPPESEFYNRFCNADGGGIQVQCSELSKRQCKIEELKGNCKWEDKQCKDKDE